MSQTTFLGKPITVEMLSKVIDELTDREALLAEIARTLRWKAPSRIGQTHC